MSARNLKNKMKPRENCIVCDGEILRSNIASSIKPKRSKLSLTCSSKCARVYRKVVAQVRNNWNRVHYKDIRR